MCNEGCHILIHSPEDLASINLSAVGESRMDWDDGMILNVALDGSSSEELEEVS